MNDPSALLALRERPNGKPNMLQNWQELTFMHWAVDPAIIQAKLPPGLTADTFDGRSYLSLVPFTMTGIRHPKLPAFPGVSAFHEWNLRGYVVGPDGPGVWFFRLDAANFFAVHTARLFFKLPYWHSQMTLTYGGGRREYGCHSRALPSDAEPWIITTDFDPDLHLAEPSSLEFWLVERYLLYSFARGTLYSGQVHHTPYQISKANVERFPQSLLDLEGFSNLGSPIPEMQFSPGVSVELFPLKKVR